MFKLKTIIYFILVAVNLHGCGKILEPVIFDAELDNDDISEQEEFNINIDALTFENARKANEDHYPRKLMVTGSGARANIFDETKFLISEIPEDLKNDDYRLGFGDELSYELLGEYKNESAYWPSDVSKVEYTLGIGDELTFTQTSSPGSNNYEVKIDETGEISSAKNAEENIITTGAIIGSGGKVLLLGIGNIDVLNRTLNEVKLDIRNILIRNGQTPNFQIEISKFKSKRAYITQNDSPGKSIPINNIPISLQEIALGSGISMSQKKLALIVLVRSNQEYRLTAEQLFNSETPEIFIRDKDIIEINTISNTANKISAIVGVNKNILLPEVGNLNVYGLTLNEVNEKIHRILVGKGLMPNFQLELTNFKSKKIFFIQKNVKSEVIILANFKTTLKEVLLKNAAFNTKTDSLFVITLKRKGKTYRLTLDKILDPLTPDIWIEGNDQIEIENLIYKPGQVYALSGNGNAEIVPINPSKRETLASIIFSTGGALNNLNAKKSEIYLLRGRNPAVAYHLDAQNVSRILIAAQTELRPNDIIYAAERPIISFSRVLSEFVPLRLLLRDINDGNIP